MDGWLYVLHWSPPLDGGQRPQHYLGWTPDDPRVRLRDHLEGRNRPAKIVQAAKAAGRTAHLARTFPGTRTDESRLKRSKHGFRAICPLCNPERYAV